MAGTLRDIRLFVAAYEERSFTAAAHREHATQSGVSQHIRNLESQLGVELFTRDKGQVASTPAGDSYYRRCIDVLRAHAIATDAARSFAGSLKGVLVVGLMPTMTRCLLAPVLAKFAEDHPNMVVRIVEGYSGPLTQQVRGGELDFAIVPTFPDISGMKSQLFLRTPEVLVTRAGDHSQHGRPVELATWGRLKLVLPSKINTRRQLIESYCVSNAVEVDRLIEMDAMLGTLDFVARSDWCTILPGIMMAVDDPASRLSIRMIADPPLNLDLVLIEPARRPMTQPARTFLAMLRDEGLRLNARWDAPPPSPAPAKSPHRKSRA